MKKYIIFLTILAGCYSKSILINNNKQLLNTMDLFFSYYTEGDTKKLSDMIDDNCPCDKNQLINAINKQIRKNKNIQLTYNIKKIIETDQKVVVYILWKKRYLDITINKTVIKKGKAELYFIKADKDYILSNIKGENPL